MSERAVVIDRLSATSCKLEMMCNNKPLAYATGFFWSNEGGRLFLVSNWHVFSGRSTYTGQPMHESCSVPETVHFRSLVLHDGRIQPIEGIFPLEDNERHAIWFQHPKFGQDRDIADLELPESELSINIFAISNADAMASLRVSVASDVFIVGFPRGISKQLHLPIWKRGSIASEMNLPFDDLPVFLVDTATREGMSGSPVFARAVGNWMTESGAAISGPDTISKFIGVYSGRHGADDELSAQLGRVWHANQMEEVIHGGARGSYVLRQW